MKLKILDLFSGLGGFSLGLERTGHFKTVAFCDNDKFSNLVLQKHWKGVKIYNNVKEITKERLEADGIESPDIITGGFPCQPFSVAGKQKGTSDDRHLWPEMFRIIKALKPRFVIGENVRGIINIQDGVVFETVCTDLESEGYEVQPFIIPAAGVGAPHRRERVWIIAIREESVVNSNNIRLEQHIETEKEASRRRSSTTFESTGDVSNTESERTRKNDKGLWSRTSGISGGQRASKQDVENSNDNGLEGRLSETRNEASTRKESSINGIKNTNLSSRRSDGRRDNEQSRVDGEVQRLRNGNEKESTEAARVRGLYERTNISEGATRENRNYENDRGALVSKRQTRIQSSIDRGLEFNQTASKNNQIRQRDDNSSLNRMERRDENVENSRRTLRQRTELRKENEDEIRKEDANQHQRSGSSSESDVADTNESGSRKRKISGNLNNEGRRTSETRRESLQSEDRQTRTDNLGSGSEDVADTESSLGNDVQTITGTSKSKTQEVFGDGSSLRTTQGKSFSEDVANSECIGQSRSRKPIGSSDKETNRDGETSDVVNGSEREQGWWDIEPDVGRVAYGVSGRIHRLKGLGNSIVPQIAEEIGRAIIKAENETQ